jgi:DNA-binding transcriptional LysR family regulator
MNLAALDLNLLVALEALLVEESVGRAASRVGLSQPAMSHALNRLRALVGDPLLVRTGAGMQPTRRAQSMREPLREALARVRGVLQPEAFDPATSERAFRILMSDYASAVVLQPLLALLTREAPGVRVEVSAWKGKRGDVLEAARAADVVLTCELETPGGFHRQRLFTDRDALALRKGHPRRRALRSARGFLDAAHVAVAEREFAEDPVDTWLRGEGRSRRVAMTVSHYLQALHLVAQTDLVAVIPERLIRACPPSLGLQSVPVPIDAGTFDEFLLHPARSHTDAGGIWLRGVLKSIASGLGPL